MITKKEYNIAIIDTSNAVEVLGILNDYGANGWMFVGWVDGPPVSLTMVNFKHGIFVRDTGKQIDKD